MNRPLRAELRGEQAKLGDFEGRKPEQGVLPQKSGYLTGGRIFHFGQSDMRMEFATLSVEPDPHQG